MHLDLFVRGKKEMVDLWEAHVQAQYFRFRRINLKTGKEESILVQMGLRRGIFGSYELVFPREALVEVLAMLGIKKRVSYAHLNGAGLKHFVMRKMWSDKPIPKKILEQANKTKSSMYFNDRERGLANCEVPGTAIHVIGIKEDKFGSVDGIYSHELL